MTTLEIVKQQISTPDRPAGYLLSDNEPLADLAKKDGEPLQNALFEGVLKCNDIPAVIAILEATFEKKGDIHIILK